MTTFPRLPQTRFYRVRGNRHTWARIWLTDDGCLTILSDFGNYGHWWGGAAGEFRAFLIDCEADYLMKKLADGERVFDGPATVRLIRELILSGRQHGKLSRAAARREWDLIAEYATMDRVEVFRDWANDTDYFAADYWELSVYGVPWGLRHFMQELWPLFIAQLEAELAAEREPVPEPFVVGGEWIGVDLDMTLAEYRGEQQSLRIGPPVPKMLALVKELLARGEDVRIFTARVDGGLVALASGNPVGEAYRDIPAIRAAIEAWCLEHVGRVLPITNVKDYGMKRLYDDKAVQVEANTGRIFNSIVEPGLALSALVGTSDELVP